MADDRHTEDEDYPNDAKRLTVDDLDVVDPLLAREAMVHSEVGAPPAFCVEPPAMEPPT